MSLGDSLGPQGKRPELYGVGGWLAFLCILLVLITPAGAIIRIAALLLNRNADPVEQTIGAVFLLVIAAFAIVTGTALIQGWRRALRLAKVYFFVNLAYGLLNTVYIAGNGDAGLIQSAFQNAIAAAWLVYLFMSERVRNTYSRDKSDSTAEVFR